MKRLAFILAAALLVGTAMAQQQDGGQQASPAGERQMSADEQAYLTRLRSLGWIKGPTTVDVAGNSKLAVPEGFVFLGAAGTKQFLEMNRNFGDGKEVMIAPQSLDWAAYFEFDDSGYVKDDESIDATALLKSLKENTEAANEERQRRRWPAVHVIDWATSPAYNRQTRRLEWATLLESEGGRSVNFSTKVLGRHGHTSVTLVVAPDGLRPAEASLNTILAGYQFNSGESYAEWRQGDKVAEYGLAALVLGGAAAVATKKGLWAAMAGFLTVAWKFIAAAVLGAGAWLRSLFKKKD